MASPRGARGRQAVARETLFEIGSVSKIFAALLASYAEASGRLSLQDATSRHIAELRGSAFDRVSLLELGTYTNGGLQLQVPDGIDGMGQLFRYLKAWTPPSAPGTSRRYSNISIGLLGLAAARSLEGDYRALLTEKLFPALGLHRLYLEVPADRMADYAQGYTKQGTPIRMREGVLAAETYGVRACAPDLLRLLDLTMGGGDVAPAWRRALAATRTGYFRAGALIQDLVWEQYPWPVPEARVLAGNAKEMIFDATPASRLAPALPPRADALIDKTGSTNGFSAYVACIPAKHAGIVMLANRNIPIAPQVSAGYRVLAALT